MVQTIWDMISSVVAAIIDFSKNWGNGAVGVAGLMVVKAPTDPKTLVLHLTAIALICQLIHTAWNFCKWCNSVRAKVLVCIRERRG